MSRKCILAALGHAVPVLAAAGIAAFIVPATARASAPGSPQSTPVMVVLDASGSMTTSDAPGPRITAAKQAVTGLVGSLPSDAQVGLEVYGTSTGSSNVEKAAGCKDIKVLVPVGPVDTSSFDAKVAGIRASGYTPIGESLLKAAANLPKEGPRSIVLVSDGEDTCAPPQPCAVAKQLKKAGVDLVVHTVGFKVNAAARAQLVCIADVTGGTYVDAPDGPSLGRQLRVRVNRALQPYSARGTPIEGTSSAAGAPELKPGQYVDSYDRGSSSLIDDSNGTAKYYSAALRKGETPYLSATAVPTGDRGAGLDDLGVEATMTDLHQTPGCRFVEQGSDLGPGRTVSAPTAVLSPGEVGGAGWPTGCPTDGAFSIKIVRTGNADRTQPVRMEIALRMEPHADDAGLPPAAAAQPNVRTGASASSQDAAAGSSYNDAPLITPGSYRDSVVSGETRYYKVHVPWGQRLAYELTPARLPGRAVGDGVVGSTRIANPLRAGLKAADGGSDLDTDIGSTGGPLYGSSAVPVRYTNRRAGDDEVKKYAVDGDYFVVFSTGFPRSGPMLTIPYTVTVSVVGTPERGPTYEPLASSDPSASGKHAAAPSLPASSPVAGSNNNNNDGGVSAPVVVGGTAAGVLACAGAVTALTLRRRRLSGSHTQTPPGNDPWS